MLTKTFHSRPDEENRKLDQHSVGVPQHPDRHEHNTVVDLLLLIIKQTKSEMIMNFNVHASFFQPFSVELEWEECFEGPHEGINDEVEEEHLVYPSKILHSEELDCYDSR